VEHSHARPKELGEINLKQWSFFVVLWEKEKSKVNKERRQTAMSRQAKLNNKGWKTKTLCIQTHLEVGLHHVLDIFLVANDHPWTPVPQE